MKRSVGSLCVLASLVVSFLSLQAGCGDSLVGLECASGFVICDGRCVDLSSDELSCGSCGSVCAVDEMCIASECTTDFDSGRPGPDGEGGMLDGGAGEGGADGGLDGGPRDGGDAASEGWADVELPPICTGAGSPADCVCDLGQLVCESTCVDANFDTFNCGACGNNCNAVPPPSGTYFCVQGRCVLNCSPPLSVCGNACVDLQTDPNNCGSCGFVCESGLCDLGQCLDRTAGHVILIGHDMSSALPATRRLAGNAIFLPSKPSVRLLIYEGAATLSARIGVSAAITEAGRVFDRADVADVNQVQLQLSQADVFLILAQANATDAELDNLGSLWGRALRTFVARGGVIVVFDGGGTNSGTQQILEEAGMFTMAMDGRMELSPRIVNIEASGDALASFVPAMYQAQTQTVGYDTTESTVVVRDRVSNLPVVIHIAR